MTGRRVGTRTRTGLKSLIDQVGPKPIIDEIGMDRFVAELTPEQRAELLQRLQHPQGQGRRK